MPTDPVLYTFHIATILTLFLSGIFIVSVRGIRPPTVYLSLERFVSAILCIVNIFQTAHTPIYGQLLWNPLHLLMLLSVYPFLFAYILGMVCPGSPDIRYWLWAYLPLAALAAFYYAFEALFGKLPIFSNYAEVGNHLNLPQLWVLFASVGFSIVLISLYTVRTVGALRQHKRNLESNFSYTEGNTLGWMWWVIVITLFKWLILLTRIMVEGNTSSFIGLFFFSFEPVIIAVLVIRQKDLYSKPFHKKGDYEDVPGDENRNDDLSGQQPNKRESLRNNLLSLLEKDEIFVNPELNSETVSEMLSTNRTYLSQIINQDMNTTFYQLINTYRLNKSVEMMRNPLYRNMSLRSISEICGFKSLSAFCTFFKQVYGQTPTEWVKERF